MTLQSIRARVLRLDMLTRGLAKETVLIAECDDPLLYRERLDYLSAIRKVLAGVDGARIVLVKARQRIEQALPKG
jgi:hypothetical protein